jgi:hypothetical protein
MNPEPLRERIPAALDLQPMTAVELARCLSVSVGSVRNRLPEIDLRVVGTVRTHGRPWVLYAPMRAAA